MLRIAINGFGRIGRMILRAMVENPRDKISIVAINDSAHRDALIHLFKYDSTHGRFRGSLLVDQNKFDVGLGPIKIISELNPEKLPWRDLEIDLVLECSGNYLLSEHLQKGAKRVLVSTIVEGADKTIIYGINHDEINSNHKLISNASCTSNCLLTVLHPLHADVGIKYGNMISVHAYTNNQYLVDTAHFDLQRSRAVGASIIPSTTNAAKAIPLIIPELAHKVHCTAIRVPTLNVSMIDFSFVSNSHTTREHINENIINASKGYLKDILGYTDEPLVSIDFNHDPHSAIVDLSQTKVTGGYLCKVSAWYDNEWGYANRLCDVANYISQRKLS